VIPERVSQNAEYRNTSAGKEVGYVPRTLNPPRLVFEGDFLFFLANIFEVG